MINISKKAKDFNPRGDNIETLTNDIFKVLNIMSATGQTFQHIGQSYLWELFF